MCSRNASVAASARPSKRAPCTSISNSRPMENQHLLRPIPCCIVVSVAPGGAVYDMLAYPPAVFVVTVVLVVGSENSSHDGELRKVRSKAGEEVVVVS